MKSPLYPLLVVCTMLLIGCSQNPNTKLLESADAVMEDDPQQAMAILQTVDTCGLDDEQAAYRALLYTQAQYKNSIKVSSDTLISRAYQYYKDRNEGDRTMRAYYYEAKAVFHGGDLRNAIPDALTAYEMAKERNDPFWIARSAELLSDIYYKSYKYEEAAEYTQEVIKNYGLANKTSNQRYAIVDLSDTYSYIGRRRDGLTILDSLLTVCENETPVDSNLIRYIRTPYINISTALKDIDKLNRILKYKTDRTYQAVDDAIQEIDINIANNDYDSAEIVLKNAIAYAKSESDTTHWLYSRYEILKNKTPREIYNVADSLLLYQGRIVSRLLKESVSVAKGRFYNNKADITKLKKENTQRLLYGAIIFFVVVIALLLVIYSIIVKNKRIQLENTLNALLIETNRADSLNSQRSLVEDKLKTESEKVSKLQVELDSKQQLVRQNTVTIESLFRNQWKTLNLLCDEYYEKYESESTRKAMLKSIEEEIIKLRSPENLKNIENSVNTYMNDVIKKLRSECPQLNEDEYMFVMLSYAGFSIRAICLLNNIKYKTYHNKKSRIIKKIQISGSPNTAEFLALL